MILSCTEWDLLDSLKELVTVQSDSLTSLKPTISYIVNKNRFSTATKSSKIKQHQKHKNHNSKNYMSKYDIKKNKSHNNENINKCRNKG